jgi:hypothetical protein
MIRKSIVQVILGVVAVTPRPTVTPALDQLLVRVRDAQGSSLPGAVVSIQVGGQPICSCVADVKGTARFRGITSQSVDVLVSLMGFSDFQSKKVFLEPATTISLDAFLRLAPFGGDRFVDERPPPVPHSGTPTPTPTPIPRGQVDCR